MITGCQQIDQVINFAGEEGNLIFYFRDVRDENGKLIVWMYEPLSPALKSKIELNHLKLDFWDSKGVPHNPAATGYTCSGCQVVLCFPNIKTPRVKSSHDGLT